MILEIELAGRHIDRYHRARLHGPGRLLEFGARDHDERTSIHRRKNLSECHLRLPALDRKHHAGNVLPGDLHLRADLRLAGFLRHGRLCDLRSLAGLLSALGTTLAAAFEFLHFAGHPFVVRRIRCIRPLHPVPKIVQLLTGQLGKLLLGLRFADRPNRILNLTVGVGDHPLRLLLGLFQDFRALLPDARKLVGIGLFQLLDLAVGDPDAVALLLPVMFVTGDFTQLFLEVDMIAAGLFARIADNILRQPDLAGDLHRERTARLADLEPKQRPDILHVEHHRSVGDSLGVRRIILNVGIVGRNHPVTAFTAEPFEDRLRDRPADDRLRTRTELVDKHQRPVRSSGEHVLHIEQVRRIGRKIVVDRLLVPDVDH